MEYIPCYIAPAEHWGLLPATRLPNRKILIEQISKSGQGQHSVYSVDTTHVGGTNKDKSVYRIILRTFVYRTNKRGLKTQFSGTRNFRTLRRGQKPSDTKDSIL